jgi:hypothetical protein
LLLAADTMGSAMARGGAILVLAVLASACRLGFDAQPLGVVDDDAGPTVDADPLAPDASQIDAAGAADGAPDAAPATATQSQSGINAPETASDEIEIQPVVLSESFVVCSRRSTSSNPNLNLARCQLVDGSTLRIESESLGENAMTAWTVVQVPGALVQRGTVSFGVNDVTRNVSIAAVDRTKTFALVSTTSTQAGVDNDERSNTLVEITSETNLSLRRGSGGEVATVDYQVIELPATAVQSGLATLDATTSSVIVDLTTVDLSRTFALHSVSIGADVDGAEAVYMTRAQLTEANLTITRQSVGEPLEVSWFAVELPLGSTVISQEGQTTAPHMELSFELNDPNYTESMFSFAAVEIDSGTSRTALNAASFTSTMGADQQRLTRSVSDGSPLFFHATAVDIVIPLTQ